MVIVWLVASAAIPAGARAGSPVPSACFGSGSGTNSVVRFYLAVNQRRFAAAYQCLSPVQTARLSFPSFKKEFAHTRAAHLVYADDRVPNGRQATSVRVKVYLFDRAAGVLTRTDQTGSWVVDSSHLMSEPKLNSSKPVVVSAPTPTRPLWILASAKLIVQRRLRLAVTGRNAPDLIFLTAHHACGECRAQQLWIFSQDSLVYQQAVDNPQILPWRNHLAMQVRTDTPGTKGVDTAHPTSRTYLTWFWTQLGFVLHKRQVVTF